MGAAFASREFRVVERPGFAERARPGPEPTWTRDRRPALGRRAHAAAAGARETGAALRDCVRLR